LLLVPLHFLLADSILFPGVLTVSSNHDELAEFVLFSGVHTVSSNDDEPNSCL
jgi:hypothetical protein